MSLHARINVFDKRLFPTAPDLSGSFVRVAPPANAAPVRRVVANANADAADGKAGLTLETPQTLSAEATFAKAENLLEKGQPRRAAELLLALDPDILNRYRHRIYRLLEDLLEELDPNSDFDLIQGLELYLDQPPPPANTVAAPAPPRF